MKTCLLILAIFFNLNVTTAQQIKIVDQSKSAVYCEGNNTEIYVDADGSNLTYSWYKDGIQIPDQTTRFLTIKNLSSLSSGIYYCIVSSEDKQVFVRSKDIAVYIATPTKFIKKPLNAQWVLGSNVEFVTQLHSNDLQELKDIKIQWYKEIYDAGKKTNIRTLLNDDNKYSGTKTEKLLIRKLIYSDKANYICIADGLCGSDSVKAFIGDVSYFKIIKETDDFNDCEGQNAVFRVKVIQSVEGTLEYQWYKPGYKKIEESSKFVGTKTRELTVKNVKKEDNAAIYVLVTLKEYGISARSEMFIMEAKYKPIIRSQPQDYIIHNRDNQYQNTTFIQVTIANNEYCFFGWYRNDTLVKKDLNLYSSNYDLGPRLVPPPPRAAVKSDVGLYRCEITNDCGSTWSDYARVTWGVDDTQECAGKPHSIVVDNYNTDKDSSYYYIWKKNGAVISDNFKFSGSSTYKLSMTEVSVQDSGFYDVWVKNFKNNVQTYLGKSYLTVAVPPYIVKQLPDTMRYEDAKFLPQKYITVFSDGPILYYQLFKDGKPYNEEAYIKINNIYSQYQPFLFGGYVNIPPGKYHYHFRNSCGEVDSKDFVIINEFQSGTVKPDTNSVLQPGEPYSGNMDQDLNTSVLDENLEVNSLSVSPNPANEYFLLTLNSSLDESADIELYDSFGKLLHKESRFLIKGINKYIINSANLGLSNGVYFIHLRSENRIINGSVVIVK